MKTEKLRALQACLEAEQQWQIERVLQVCPTCPITEEEEEE